MTAPAWDGCEIVRDREADLWLIVGYRGTTQTVYTSDTSAVDYTAADLEATYGPCVPILGPEGEPVVTETDIDNIADELGQQVDRHDLAEAIAKRLYVWDGGTR